MKVSGVALFTVLSPALGSLFFQESKADRIKNNLNSIGYEVLDSAGLVKDSVIESLDPESLKDWLEAHGVTDAASQTVETAKQHKDWLLEDIRDYAEYSQDFASALLSKGKEFFSGKADELSDAVFNTWSDSRVKEFLDARGVNVPQGSSRNELNALAARFKHSLPVNVNGPAGQFWFDGWSREELVKKLEEAGESIEGSRKELAQRVHKLYVDSYNSGKVEGEKAAEHIGSRVEDLKEEGSKVASEAAEHVATAYEDVKEHGDHAAHKIGSKLSEWRDATADSFNSWSLDDLREYVREFGVDVADTKDKLVEAARYHYHYFTKGQAPPQTTYEKIKAHLSNTKSTVLGYLGKIVGVNAIFHNEL